MSRSLQIYEDERVEEALTSHEVQTLCRTAFDGLFLVDDARRYLFINEPLMILFMLLLVGACCIRNDNGLSWILSNPVARYIGTVSYGLYLLHMIAMNGTKFLRKEHDWLFFAIALAISTAMASASYWMFESPFLRLKNRFRKAEPAHKPTRVSIPSTTALPFDPIRA